MSPYGALFEAVSTEKCQKLSNLPKIIVRVESGFQFWWSKLIDFTD